MKERPILFKGEMVRAILAGTKTQTRRIAKLNSGGRVKLPGSPKNWHCDDPNAVQACPHGKPGDQLWLKETHCYSTEANELVVAYRADEWTECPSDDGKWRPSIFCTRAASRITLEITAVRIERLNDISEADAKAEGVDSTMLFLWRKDEWQNSTPNVARYAGLWESINGAGSFFLNPFVWVIDFTKRSSS